MRDDNGRFLPGESGNPSGRPRLPVSITKVLRNRLEEHPERAEQIVDDWLFMSKAEFPAIREILDRIDGKVATEVNLKGLIIHVGDDYAQLGIEANRKELENRRIKYLDAPQQDQG